MNPRTYTALLVFLGIALGVLAVDLWSKEAVFSLLEVRSEGEPPRVVAQKPKVVVPGFFELEANYNYGAFSGWFSEHTEWLAVLSALALVVIAGIVVYVLRRPGPPSLWFLAALGLIAGGTAGNLYDRVALEAVRDWIKWFVVIGDREYVWPNFNIADSAICVGVALLLVMELFRGRKQGPEEEEERPSA